ncbi:MAG TPA: DUF485 domain-containing protein [Baekduia sp.]|nr:DUF485 domain-containing protein [Baekduia sp.]
MTQIDFEAAHRSPEFQELVAKRRRFVVPATAGFLGWYLAFVLLCGYAPDAMGESVYQGFTVGYALALTQFVMVWGLGWAYLRYSERVLDPLRERCTHLATTGALGVAEAPVHAPAVHHAHGHVARPATAEAF